MVDEAGIKALAVCKTSIGVLSFVVVVAVESRRVVGNESVNLLVRNHRSSAVFFCLRPGKCSSDRLVDFFSVRFDW
jgi:hypothetical protein